MACHSPILCTFFAWRHNQAKWRFPKIGILQETACIRFPGRSAVFGSPTTFTAQVFTSLALSAQLGLEPSVAQSGIPRLGCGSHGLALVLGQVCPFGIWLFLHIPLNINDLWCGNYLWIICYQCTCTGSGAAWLCDHLGDPLHCVSAHWFSE